MEAYTPIWKIELALNRTILFEKVTPFALTIAMLIGMACGLASGLCVAIAPILVLLLLLHSWSLGLTIWHGIQTVMLCASMVEVDNFGIEASVILVITVINIYMVFIKRNRKWN